MMHLKLHAPGTFYRKNADLPATQHKVLMAFAKQIIKNLLKIVF